MTPAYSVEPLGAAHDRKTFNSGVAALDHYFRDQAGQDMRRRVAACYVASETEGSGRVAGFYTLSAAGVPLAEVPPALARRLPRYGAVPVARLGRLAVDEAFRGLGLGGALLWDAVQRALRSEVMVFAMIVEAKDDGAEAFYRHHGFLPFGERRLILVLTGDGLR